MNRAARTSLCCLALSSILAASGAVAACSSDDGAAGTPPPAAGGDASTDAATAAPDSTGPIVTTDSSVAPGPDSSDSNSAPGSDAATADAADSAPIPDAAVQHFCQTQSGLAFCADFDEALSLSLDAGAGGGWDQVVGSATELALSTAQSVSAPSSLLLTLTNPPNTDQSAKVVKMVSPLGGLTQAIYEFDVYIATVPTPAGGGFLTDFQFSDTPGGGGGGADQFGFRIAIFSTATGTFDHADFEHNAPALSPAPPDDVVSPFPITPGAWSHVKIAVAYSSAGFDGGNGVSVKAYSNGSATPAADKVYPAPFAAAPFARIALGMVYAFQASAKDYGIYFDNVTLKLQ